MNIRNKDLKNVFIGVLIVLAISFTVVVFSVFSAFITYATFNVSIIIVHMAHL